MLQSPTIQRAPRRRPALDLEQLCRQGMERIRELSGREWTDHNVHDPGITLLEVLCYALTDLSYRADLPVEDLLTDAQGGQGSGSGHTLYTARQILHNRPLTELDYRRLLIDLNGVRNAWIRPFGVTYFADPKTGELKPENDGTPGLMPVGVRGLYDVLLDFEEDQSTEEKAAVREQVTRTLQRYRNLCEDFAGIDDIRKQNFILCGEFELDPEAETAEVKARILFEVQQYLAPAVASYTLAEMQARTMPDGSHYTVDDVFDGPPLEHGFIPDDELKNAVLRAEIRLSDIINIIMDIPGVQAVRRVLLNRPGEDEPLSNPWLVPVRQGTKAHLQVENCRLVFYKQDLPVMAQAGRVAERLKSLTKFLRTKAESPKGADFPIPTGRYRNPGDYYGAHYHLPQLYGIGANGLPAGADQNRQAQSSRLKAYLLFFEQLMANYLAQLANVRRIFSTDAGEIRTYYYQAVESLADLYENTADTAIEQALEGEAAQIERRNRFLDHLIARFGENYATFAHTMFSVFDLTPKAMARYRCGFLESYPVISSERGLAYDYTRSELKDIWNSANISGLQKRLCKLLGIQRCERRNLAAIDYDEFAEVFTSPTGQIRFRVRAPDDGTILIRSTREFADNDAAGAALRNAIEAASLPGGYARERDAGGKFRFNIADSEGDLLAVGNSAYDSEAEREAAIEALMQLLHDRYSDEGMFIIENILLRPEQAGDPMLKACLAPGCDDCPEADPYSYRIQIILPAFGARFGTMDFRNYAEQVIRAEVPAHILPKICWVDRDSMGAFEAVYQDWLKLKSGRTSGDRVDKIKRLIAQLQGVKNVYPAERLHECAEGDTRPKFIVGRKALGSMKPD